MTFTAYSPRVARGGLTDDFSKFQATADKVRDDIKADSISRALQWRHLVERGKIRGAQPPQPSQPSALEKALGAAGNWLLTSDDSPLDDWSSGLRGMFGNKGSTSNVLSGSEGAAWQAGAYSPQLDYTSAFGFGGNVPDYGIDLTPAIDFTIPNTNAFTGSGGNYF